ncbi:Lipase member H [Halotydeus destructor]|nr:Lipase member H [Halotydeus destructor]
MQRSLFLVFVLIAGVHNQNVIGAIRNIVEALEKVGFLPFVMNPDLIENYKNSEGGTAFLYRQLLTQIPQFVSNTLRDCLDTEIEDVTPEDQIYDSFRYSNISRIRKPRDTEGCPGISTIFPKDSCLGRPTYWSDPGANPKKTSLIFIEKTTGKEYVVKYDDFVSRPGTRGRVAKRFLDPQRDTNILIHGWTDHYYRNGWLWSFKEFIVRTARPAPNIIIIDWRQWSQSLAITKVKMNVVMVAEQLAAVLHMLTSEDYVPSSLKLDPMQVFIYGHSYGGPIAGLGGLLFQIFKNLNQTIRSIQALDPSDQCFGRGSFNPIDDVDSSVQAYNTLLSPASAESVEILHSDSNAFGAYSRVGTVDIYINQGSGQPDCPEDPDSINNADFLYTLACSHYRATRIMTQDYYNQADGKCEPVAYRCSSFDDFLDGSCACLFTDRNDGTSLIFGSSGRCRQLASNRYEINAEGIPFLKTGVPDRFYSRAPDTRDSWYVQMGSEPPYCLGTFLYSIRSSEIPNNVITALKIDNISEIAIDASSRRQGIISIPPDDVGRYEEIIVSYTDVPGALLGKQREFHFQSITLYYLSHTEYCVRSEYTRVYCAHDNEFKDNVEKSSKIDSTEAELPGGATTTDVKFKNSRCLEIIDFCKGNSTLPNLDLFGACQAFAINFLKDFFLALYDQNCAKTDERCAEFLICLYKLRNSPQFSFRKGGFYDAILRAMAEETVFPLLNYVLGENYGEECSHVSKKMSEDKCKAKLYDR